MTKERLLAVLGGIGLSLALCLGGAAAQTESATAEDGAPAGEAPATTPVPTVPIGANLAPPMGITPPGPPLLTPAGTGQSGSSTVSMAPGTLTTGTAREGERAVRAPEAEPAPAAIPACGDYPTWYDAQLALESSVDEATIASLDPDSDAIACEEVMYP
jgi:hypothetical protein